MILIIITSQLLSDYTIWFLNVETEIMHLSKVSDEQQKTAKNSNT